MGKLFTNLPNALNPIDLSWLTNKQKELCDNELGELLSAFKSIPNNKSLKFCEAFWNELKDHLLK